MNAQLSTWRALATTSNHDDLAAAREHGSWPNIVFPRALGANPPIAPLKELRT